MKDIALYSILIRSIFLRCLSKFPSSLKHNGSCFAIAEGQKKCAGGEERRAGWWAGGRKAQGRYARRDQTTIGGSKVGRFRKGIQIGKWRRRKERKEGGRRTEGSVIRKGATEGTGGRKEGSGMGAIDRGTEENMKRNLRTTQKEGAWRKGRNRGEDQNDGRKKEGRKEGGEERKKEDLARESELRRRGGGREGGGGRREVGSLSEG